VGSGDEWVYRDSDPACLFVGDALEEGDHKERSIILIANHQTFVLPSPILVSGLFTSMSIASYLDWIWIWILCRHYGMHGHIKVSCGRGVVLVDPVSFHG
jgi:hypothetical protein